jgi:magnesium transporter
MKKFEIPLQKIKWIDLIAPSKEELNILSNELNIPNRILVNALDPEHLPKYELIDSTAVIYLRAFDPSKPTANNILDLTTKITLIIKEDIIISIHRIDHSFIEELRVEALEKNYVLKDLIKKIITSTLMSFDIPLIILEERLALFEKNVFENSKKQNIVKEGYFLKSKASSIRKLLKFSIEILSSLPNRPEFVWKDFQGLREITERNLFYTEEVLENLSSLLNLHISLAAQRTNEIMRILTVVSIFFLPLNVLTGIYGMNFEFMPELHHPKGYFYLLQVMLIISLGIFIWVYKKGWLKKPA